MDQVLKRLRGLGPASRGELAEALGASAATIYRRLQDAEAEGLVARFGRSRATRYALRAPLFQRVADEVPLFRVDDVGHIHKLAVLVGLADGGVLVRPPSGNRELPPLLLGEDGSGCFPDLPFFLQDLRPQGFLGRQFAHSVPELPDNPERWSAAQIGAYLLDHATDLPGDLLVGESAVDRFRHWHPDQVAPPDYPALADKALAGEVAGSSAGGEQPKFPAEVEGRPVLVKFSPPATDSAVATRWRDLIVCEHLALTTLDRHGLPVAKSRLLEEDDRLFLESERFDRTPKGRLPALSLWAIDAEFVGAGQGWRQVAEALFRQGLLPAEDLERIAIAEHFADWIENTDQHLGNITLQPAPGGKLTLAPFYDMVPMRHAPRQGEIRPVPAFHPPVSRGNPAHWTQSGEMALDFWQQVSQDAQISPDFQRLAHDRARQIEKTLASANPTAPGRPENGPGWW